MPRKPITEGGRREEILDAALSLFLENGYEKTSIRMISGKVGCEVGLVYYYFKTKDDVFQSVLARYLDEIEVKFIALAEKDDIPANKILENIAFYIEDTAQAYRKTFGDTVHATVHAELRERIAAICENVLSQMLEKADRKDMGLAVFLARGLCSAAFRDDADFYYANKEDLLRTAKVLLGTDAKETTSKKREIPSFLL